MSRKLLLAFAALVVAGSVFSGCQFYFEGDDDDDDYSDYYCDDSGQCWYCDSYGCYPDNPSGYCTADDQCFAGCYCDDYGTCLESGFCSTDADCSYYYGFYCDDRGTCVPGEQTQCDPNDDSTCPSGYYCDPYSYSCYPSSTCTTDEECTSYWGAGYGCNDNGSCEYVGCQSDYDCGQGCYCEQDPNGFGSCWESGFCSVDSDCAGLGMTCDEDRGTCVPDDTTCTCDDGSACGEDGSCPQPCVCEDGSACNEDGSCPIPEPTCEELGTENECLANDACTAIYTGINCTSPDGSACDTGESGCYCEDFVYATCVTTEAPPPNT